MISQAIILAGGQGERLRPLTNDRPKAMVEVFGKPLLEYQLGWLASYGITEVVLACGHLSEVIKDYFGDGSNWRLSITYSIEQTALGRGGGLKQALGALESLTEPVLVMNGDVICDLNLQELVTFHNQGGAAVTIVSVPFKSPYGVLDLQPDSSVTGFREKPELPFWINAGIYVIQPEVKELLPDTGDHEESTLPTLARQGRLRAYKTTSFWKAVDTIKDLKELNQHIAKLSMHPFLQPMTI